MSDDNPNVIVRNPDGTAREISLEATQLDVLAAVLGALTDTQLRASPVAVTGTVATGGLTDAQLRASAVPVSAAALPLPAGAATEATLGSVLTQLLAALDTTLSSRASDSGLAAVFARQANGSQHTNVDNFPATQPVSAVALPLPAGASTEATLAAIKAKTDNLDVALSTRAITGLTDAQIRATPLPVSGPLTDAQLRAAAVPVSAAALPLPTGASTEATLALIKAKTDNIDVAISTRTKPADTQIVDGSAVTQPVSAVALPLPAGAATEATLALIKAKTDNLDVALSTRAVTGLTDAQLRATPVPISAAALPLPTGAATSALQTQPGVDIGDVTVNNAAGAAAVNIQDGGNSITVDGPLTDAQLRASAVPVSGPLTDAQLRASSVGVAVATWIGSAAPTVGQKTMADSMPFTLPSDLDTARVSATFTNIVSNTAALAMNGRGSAVVRLDSASYGGTVVPQVSYDDGATWLDCAMVLLSPNPVGTGPNYLVRIESSFGYGAAVADLWELYGISGATHVRFHQSSFTSGSLTVTLLASPNRSVFHLSQMMGVLNGGTSPYLATARLYGMSGVSGDTENVLGISIRRYPGGAAASAEVLGRSLAANSLPHVDSENQTYSAATGAFVAANLATDIAVITGSASKTVRVFGVRITGTQTTGGIVNVFLIKRSADNTGGTSAAITPVPHDSSNAAATAVVRSYTANPTGLGTAVGNVRIEKVDLGAVTALGETLEWLFDLRGAQPIVLRGAAQILAVNLNGVTVTGNSFDIEWIFAEE